MLNVRSVLVTGSNRGIGLGLVRQLVGKRNAPEWVFATCRDPEGPRAQDLKNLADKHRSVKILPVDIRDPSSIKDAAAKVTEKLQGAGLNLLINNAGIVKPSTLESETAEDMSEVYKSNVIGPMMMSQAFLPLLRKASQESPLKGMSCSKAAIVNMSSEAGSIAKPLVWDLGHIINYRCSKAALNMLTRCQSLGWTKDEILCIALHPGVVKTEMVEVEVPGMATVDESVQKILNTLGSLCGKDTGNFMNWEGTTLPW